MRTDNGKEIVMIKIEAFKDDSIADYGMNIDGESLDSAEAQLIEYINGMELDAIRHNGLMEAIGHYRAICERAVVMSCMDRLSGMLIDEA